jgi:hypothetical protein
MTKPRVHLNLRAVLWRLVAVFYLLTQAGLALAAWVLLAPRQILGFLLATFPLVLAVAYAAASLLTVVAGLMVVAVVRPLVARWHAPRGDETLGQFHLAASEWVVESTPARRSRGRWWPPGTLIRTNQRLWFVPQAPADEPWSCPLDELADVRLAPAPRVAGGLIRNWPERLAVRSARVVEAELFAVPGPADVLAWFTRPSPKAPAPSATPSLRR